MPVTTMEARRMRRLRENFNEPGTLFQLARLGVVALLLGGLGLSGAAGNGLQHAGSAARSSRPVWC